MHTKVSFKIFPWGQDASPKVGNQPTAPDSTKTETGLSTNRKFVIDPENVSSFYAVNPTILNMPFLSVNSQGQPQEKSLKNWYLDKNWFQLCNEVTSPFPMNRTVIKHELEKSNHVRFDERGNTKETSQTDSMSNLFQLGQNYKKLRALVETGSLSSNRHSSRRLPLRYDPNDKIMKDYLDLSSKKQQIRQNLKGAVPRENQRRKSCHCEWCGGISEMEKKLEKRMWLNLNGGFGPEKRRRSTSPNSSTIGGKKKKKGPSYANPLRRNKVRGITTLSRDGSKRTMERMSTVSGMESDSGDFSLGHEVSDAARMSTHLTKKKSSFMVPFERGVSKTVSKSPNRMTNTSEGLTIQVQHTSELNEMFNTPLRLKLPQDNLSSKNVKKSVGSKEALSVYTFDIGEVTNRSNTPMKGEHHDQLSPNLNRMESVVPKEMPKNNMILEFEDLEMKKPFKLRIPVHLKSPKAKEGDIEGNKTKTIKQKIIKTKETEKPKKEVLPPVKDKKSKEEENGVLKEGLKKLISERLATQPDKIVSVYENSSDYLFFKSNKTPQHAKRSNLSQVIEPTPKAVEVKKEHIRTEVSPYFMTGRSSVGMSNLLVSKKAFRIQNRSHKNINKTEMTSEEEGSVERKLNVKSIDEKGSNATTMPSKSNSLMKTAQNTPKHHYSLTTAKFIIDIPSSPKSSEDYIMNFHKKNYRRKF